VKSEVDGALHVPKHTLEHVGVAVARGMHMKAYLLNSVRDVRPRERQVLESAGHTSVPGDVGEWPAVRAGNLGLGLCRMDLPGSTTSVGTRTDYSVGPWDYPACATRHLKAWSTRTTQE
jgi:hypothetical protein